MPMAYSPLRKTIAVISKSLHHCLSLRHVIRIRKKLTNKDSNATIVESASLKRPTWNDTSWYIAVWSRLNAMYAWRSLLQNRNLHCTIGSILVRGRILVMYATRNFPQRLFWLDTCKCIRRKTHTRALIVVNASHWSRICIGIGGRSTMIWKEQTVCNESGPTRFTFDNEEILKRVFTRPSASLEPFVPVLDLSSAKRNNVRAHQNKSSRDINKTDLTKSIDLVKLRRSNLTRNLRTLIDRHNEYKRFTQKLLPQYMWKLFVEKVIWVFNWTISAVGNNTLEGNFPL